MARTDYDGYLFPNGWKMARENGETPNGNELNGCWVLRDENGGWVDYDKYSNDLTERYKLDRWEDGVISPD